MQGRKNLGDDAGPDGVRLPAEHRRPTASLGRLLLRQVGRLVDLDRRRCDAGGSGRRAL